jgi:hypothetical protein
MGTNNQAVQAFVLFRSMEGVERSLYAFDYWGISRFFYSLGCISDKRKQ